MKLCARAETTNECLIFRAADRGDSSFVGANGCVRGVVGGGEDVEDSDRNAVLGEQSHEDAAGEGRVVTMWGKDHHRRDGLEREGANHPSLGCTAVRTRVRRFLVAGSSKEASVQCRVLNVSGAVLK